jgi:replicative DNA helicase
LIDAAGQIARLAYQDTEDAAEVVDRAEEIIFGVSSQRVDRDLRPIRQVLDKFYDRIEYLHKHRGEIIGIPTGLADLDKLLGGLQRSDMVVMAGRPGMGKTSLALSVALQAARRHQKRIALFSLEMSDEQLVQRLVSAETGIDSQRIRLGDIKEDEWATFIQATNLLSNTQIFIDDTPAISALELRTKARRLHAEHGLDLLIVDYLQLMRGDSRSENRQQEISFISRSIKGLARELNIPILALSQLSRQVESRHDKRPMLSDLRESGSIEQDADVVLFIYRDEIYNPDTEFPNIAEIIVSKHRSGPTGIFSVYFKKNLAQFVDLEVRTQPLDY